MTRPVAFTNTVNPDLHELLDDWHRDGVPVRLTLSTGQTVAGPITSVSVRSVHLDPESGADSNNGGDGMEPAADWVDRFTMVDLSAVVMATYA